MSDSSSSNSSVISGDIAPLEQMKISKQLEIINFQELALKYPQSKTKYFIPLFLFYWKNDILYGSITKGKAKKWAWKRNKHVTFQKGHQTKKNVPETQITAFQGTMRLLIIIGQALGLNPVGGILATDVAYMRYTVYSWKFLYSILIGSIQAVATILSLYRLQRESISIGALAFICFFGATCATTFLFIQVAARWQKLMSEIMHSGLDDYVDNRMKTKCNIVTVVIVALGLLEHVLSLTNRFSVIINCLGEDIYDEFLKQQFPWIFGFDITRYKAVGFFLQILNIISTINWNYSDLFIICMSMYLASLLNQINKKIITASEKAVLPSSHWRMLREDYTKATRLVRSFDNILSGIVFCSFASNLFFICLQIFNMLSHGMDSNAMFMCPKLKNGWIFGGYEYTIYLVFSTTYLFSRSLTVSLVAASVHTASLVPAPALYNVPSTAFCDEVSRFIEQVHADTVALSGLQFFIVTRDLVLSVAGTIVTYELVLLQFSSISH